MPNELGEIQRSIGQLQGEFSSFRTSLIKLDSKIDANQVVNVSAHAKHDQAIAALDVKMMTQFGDKAGASRILNHAWVAAYTLGAGILVAIGSWLATGSGNAHP